MSYDSFAVSARRSASRLARALTGTRKRRDETRGHPEITLLSALEEEGCPICRVSAGHDKRYFFWFLHESYSQPEIAEQLSHSIGFCLAHGLQLAEMESASSQIASVHETLSRHLNALASNGKNRKSWISMIAARQGILEHCPACRSCDGGVRRSAFFLAGMINYPDVISRYANPGILCLPHLQMVAREVDDASFQRLLRLHAEVVSSALDAARGARRESEGNLDPCEQRLLRLAVGHDRGPGTYRLTEREGLVPTVEPAGRTGANIWKLDACPVCIEMRRAWFQWIDWLDTACRCRDSVEDMLPACPDHAWASVHRGGPALVLATARASAKTVLCQMQAALRQIDDPSPPRPKSK